MDPAGHPRGEEAVVGGVVPREHLRRHAIVVQRLAEAQRLAHFLGVDQDVLPAGIGLLDAEAVHEGAPVVVGVVAVRELHAGRMPLGLELPRGFPEIVPGLRLAHPDRGEEVLAPQNGDRDEEVGNRVPDAVDLRRALRGLEPAAVLFAEALGDIREIDEVTIVLAGEDLADEVDEVVPGPGCELGGVPGGQFEVGHVVHPHLDAGLVAPLLGELVEPHVVGRHVVAPQEHP